MGQSRDRKVTEGCALSGWPPTLFLHSTGPSLHVTPTPQQRKPGKASAILWEDEGVESIDPVSIRVSSSPSCRTHEALPQRRHPSFPHHLLSIRLRYDLLVLAKETKTTNCQPRTTYTRTGEVRDNPRGWVRDTQLPLCQDKAEIPLTGHTGGRPLGQRHLVGPLRAPWEGVPPPSSVPSRLCPMGRFPLEALPAVPVILRSLLFPDPACDR